MHPDGRDQTGLQKFRADYLREHRTHKFRAKTIFGAHIYAEYLLLPDQVQPGSELVRGGANILQGILLILLFEEIIILNNFYNAFVDDDLCVAIEAFDDDTNGIAYYS